MITAAPNVQDQPHVVVDVWRTYVIGDDVYLACVVPATGKVRVTTPVVQSDLAKQEMVTASGRVYHCVGTMAEDCLDFRFALLVNGLADDLATFTGHPEKVQ